MIVPTLRHIARLQLTARVQPQRRERNRIDRQLRPLPPRCRQNSETTDDQPKRSPKLPTNVAGNRTEDSRGRQRRLLPLHLKAVRPLAVHLL